MIEEKTKIDLDAQVKLVDDILKRYIEDEAGKGQKEKYKKMSYYEKITLLTNTLYNCSSWEDFETEMVVNFDYSNY